MAVLVADASMADKQQLIRELRKKDPQAAKRVQKKLKKKNKNGSKELLSPSRQHLLAMATADRSGNDEENGVDEDEDVEYIPSPILEGEDAELVEAFQDVFEKFAPTQPNDEEGEEEEDDEEDETSRRSLAMKDDIGGSDDEEEDGDKKPKLSKKRRKALRRPALSQLKQIAVRPEVVEVWDTTASDPKFLVWLKGYRNTLPVPNHWSHKRKYMQGRRGFEKPPFKLPEYIEGTKIMEIRQSIQERDASLSTKQKQREKVRPKMHKMDIDYAVLHDAFFKYATKPKLTKFGDVYYEGKDNEVKMRRFVPGHISDRLKEALGMADNAPPPWLINMQRYGPPPAYPGLKIMGLNAPIPAGAEYGYHAGGWGKPPVDEFGMPLYGDFRLESREPVNIVDNALWGELPSDSEDEDDDQELKDDGMKTPGSVAMGTETPFAEGMTSVASLRSIGGTSLASGLETPESLDLRKRGISSATPKPYTILQQQEVPSAPGALFGSTMTYKMPNTAHRGLHGGSVTPLADGVTTPGGAVTPLAGGGIATPIAGSVTPYGGGVGGLATPTANIGGLRTPAGVTVALNPSEMEQEGVFAADVIRHQLRQHEEAASRAKRAAGQVDPADFSKRKEAGGIAAPKKKKKKDFKF